MKSLATAGYMLALFVLFSIRAEDAKPKDGMPPMPKPQKEHEWFKQLEGEWTTESEMFMGPDQPPVKSKGAETVRLIGGFWAQCENKGEVMGAPFTGILTVGYDAEKKEYVATWIDSISSKMWQYKTTLDTAGKALIFEIEGPCPMEPAKIVKIKETLEIKDKDNKVFTSMMEIDGKWVTALTVKYTRKK